MLANKMLSEKEKEKRTAGRGRRSIKLCCYFLECGHSTLSTMPRCSALLLLLAAVASHALPYPHHGDHEHPHPESTPTMEMEVKPVEEMQPMEEIKPVDAEKIDMPSIEMQPVELMETKPMEEEKSEIMEEMKPMEEQKNEEMEEIKPMEEEKSEIIEEMEHIESVSMNEQKDEIMEEMKPAETMEEIKPVDEKKDEMMEEMKPVETMEEMKPVETMEEMKPVDEKKDEMMEEMKPVETMEEMKPMDEKKDEMMEEMKPVDEKKDEMMEEIKPIEMMEEMKPMDEKKDEMMEEKKPVEIMEEMKPVDKEKNEMMEEMKPVDEKKDEMMEEMKPIETNPTDEQKVEMTDEIKPAEMPVKETKPSELTAEMDSIKGEEVRPASDKVKQDAVTGESGAETYSGAQMLRVKAVTPEQKHLLNTLEEAGFIDTWLRPAKGRGEVDIMVSGDVLPIVKRRLADLRAEYRVVIQDVQRAIEAENPVMSEEELSELADRKGHRMTWSSYHPLTDIHGYLDFLAQTYPDLCSVTTIGSSVEGQPLKLLRISSRKGRESKASRPAFWIDGGIHAREWISPASVTYIIQQLVEFHDQHGKIAEDIDYYILPVVNPDGYEYTRQRERLWRKNRKDSHLGRCAGTDLNRNWGYKWGGPGSSRDKCKEIYAGANAFSEPETQAIRNFVSGQASSIRAYVTFHSYGQYILYPWGYDRKVPPDYADLDRVGKQAAAAMRSAGGASYTVGNSASTLYPASGGADDWAKGGPRIKYTYTIELRDRGQYGFLLPANYIEPTGKEAFAAVKTIAQAILTP